MNEQQLPNIEYFYGEQLRWSYGFDNPNKGAVVWACLVPLFFALWVAAWRVRNVWLRAVAVLLSGVAFLGSAYLLFMTYSRGGLVAAGVGVLYVLCIEVFRAWGMQHVFPRGLIVATVGLFLLGTGALYSVGLASRTVAPITTQDNSVGNRFVVWTSGLQMAAENPRGLGTGTSGKTYMAWYQPIERNEGYRTLVNSYLTFLTEQGFLIFFAALIVALFLWLWARPRTESATTGDIALGLRGVVLAFAVSGFFSTVMEEPTLWIIPGVAMLALVCWTVWRRNSWPKLALAGSFILAVGICFLLWIAGTVIGARDPLTRIFVHKDGGLHVLDVKPKAGAEYIVNLIGDTKVTGEEPGKLIRQLALDGKGEVRVGTSEKGINDKGINPDVLAVAGNGIAQLDFSKAKAVVLIAPGVTDDATAKEIIKDGSRVTLLVPEIDEDGRANFWEGTISESGIKTVHQETLSGMGNDVTQAWPQVVAAVRAAGKR